MPGPATGAGHGGGERVEAWRKRWNTLEPLSGGELDELLRWATKVAHDGKNGAESGRVKQEIGRYESMMVRLLLRGRLGFESAQSALDGYAKMRAREKA